MVGPTAIELRGTPELFRKLVRLMTHPDLDRLVAEIEDQLEDCADREHDFVCLEEVLP